MKKYTLILFAFFMIPFVSMGQEENTEKEEEVKEKLERPAYESSFIIDNPTNVLFNHKALEVTMAHRFGVMNNKGGNDLVGFWAPSNIRIGLSYAIHERLTIGYGTTKFDRLQDFNFKVALLRQTRSEKVPVSVTYYGNFTIDASKKDAVHKGVSKFGHLSDRWSNFHQLIIARRITPAFSAQVAPSISHYNVVDNTMRNDMVAISFGGRFKISPQTSILADYSQPITKFMKDNPHPGISIGVEFATSAHAFQLFATNLNGLVPQKNYMFNQNDFFNGDILIGFNITRIYNF